jgi:Parvulin-like peptidyl-prolyl isomerase
MKKKIIILSCCFLALIVTACGKSTPKLKNGEEVVASVDGKKVTADELYKELKRDYGYDTIITMLDKYIADKEIETTPEITKNAQEIVDYYVDMANSYGIQLEELLMSFGLYGISNDKEFLDYLVTDYKQSLAVQTHVGTKFTDKEIEKYYNENYTKQLTVRHILIEIEESDKDGKKALATINDLIDQLKKTKEEDVETKFIELAKEYSDDGSYSTGGLISDFMSSTVVPEFWNASNKLKDGEFTTTAVKSKYGYHIIYRKSIKDKPTLKSAEKDIRLSLAEIAMAKDELLTYTAMAELRTKYKIKIHDTDLNDSYDELLKQLGM